MKNTICPKCFAQHPDEEFAYSCTHEGCEKEGFPIPPQEVVQGEGKEQCPACKSVLTERLCPECGYPIVIGDDSAPTMPISIVGAESCGKSNYLSVLINQLRSEVGNAYNCALYPLGGDETIQHYENHYYRPLFEKGECILSTQQEEIVPLIYSLMFSGNPASGKTCNLTFYDACGANFESERKMADYNRSIYNAKGILFFIDPSQLPVVQEYKKARGLPVCKGDPRALLSRTIYLIRHGGGKKNIKRKIDIPIAVCLTKVDTLKTLLDPSSFVRYPSRHLNRPIFDTADFTSASLEVESLIESWAGAELVNQVTSQFSNYGFFGFSSLGVAPDEENHVHHIAPHRVCDPLLWVLWKNKIIRGGSPERTAQR